MQNGFTPRPPPTATHTSKRLALESGSHKKSQKNASTTRKESTIPRTLPTELEVEQATQLGISLGNCHEGVEKLEAALVLRSKHPALNGQMWSTAEDIVIRCNVYALETQDPWYLHRALRILLPKSIQTVDFFQGFDKLRRSLLVSTYNNNAVLASNAADAVEYINEAVRMEGGIIDCMSPHTLVNKCLASYHAFAVDEGILCTKRCSDLVEQHAAGKVDQETVFQTVVCCVLCHCSTAMVAQWAGHTLQATYHGNTAKMLCEKHDLGDLSLFCNALLRSAGTPDTPPRFIYQPVRLSLGRSLSSTMPAVTKVKPSAEMLARRFVLQQKSVPLHFSNTNVSSRISVNPHPPTHPQFHKREKKPSQIHDQALTKYNAIMSNLQKSAEEESRIVDAKPDGTNTAELVPSACIIQCWYRQCAAKQRYVDQTQRLEEYLKQTDAVLTIQEWSRNATLGRSTRREVYGLMVLKNSCTLVQTRLRSLLSICAAYENVLRREIQTKKDIQLQHHLYCAAVMIQCTYRGHHARCRLRHMVKSARKIQRFRRWYKLFHMVRTLVLVLRSRRHTWRMERTLAARKIQRWYRSFAQIATATSVIDSEKQKLQKYLDDLTWKTDEGWRMYQSRDEVAFQTLIGGIGRGYFTRLCTHNDWNTFKHQSRCATTIQLCWRQSKCRSTVKGLRKLRREQRHLCRRSQEVFEATKLIQRMYRGFLGRNARRAVYKKMEKHVTAAVLISNVWLRHKARKVLKEKMALRERAAFLYGRAEWRRWGAMVIQRLIRRYKARRRCVEQKSGIATVASKAIVLQKFIRSIVSKARVRNAAAIALNELATQSAIEYRFCAARRIQSWFRMWRMQRVTLPQRKTLYDQRFDLAARTIQRAFINYRVRSVECAENDDVATGGLLANQYATEIQRVVRGWIVRNYIARETAALQIQSTYRNWKSCKTQERVKKSKINRLQEKLQKEAVDFGVVRIQALWRGACVRLWKKKRMEAGWVVLRALRRNVAKTKLNKMKKQRSVSRTQATIDERGEAAMKIQQLWRSKRKM